MQNISIIKLPLNILAKLNYLKQDYIGLHFDINIILNLILGLAIAFGLIAMSSLLGKKIIDFIFKKSDLENNYLVNIAIGYITVATGITILGFFSVLTPFAISIYLISLVLISFYPYNNLLSLSQKLYLFLLKTIKSIGENKMILTWVMLFIFLAIINLVNPEIREDQYHVDFPKMYLLNHTIMIPPREQFTVSGSPMLSEMYYTIGIFLLSEESARYIHFAFYMLIILALYEFAKIKKYKYSLYNLLLFVSAPVVIHETSSMYVDFEWMFCFLVSILILTRQKKLSIKVIALSGIILGGMLASKLWTIIFIPVSIIYLIFLLNKSGIKYKLRKVFLFTIATIIAPSLWFIRSYILTGDALFPAFAYRPTLENTVIQYGISQYLGLNTSLLNPINFINVFSPLFFLGCVLILYKLKENIKELISLNIFKYFLILFLFYISVQYPYGRYLLGLYLLFIFIASLGLSKILNDFKITKYIINIFLAFFFLYYLINSALVLPYAFGSADKNKYLTRILSKDWSSYYDYSRKFDKYISKKDYVATYGIFGYYYANFHYLDVNFVFDPKRKSFDILKKNGFTKLFIKGGDINYFCKKISLKDCASNHYSLVSSYTPFPRYYLYNIK
jgi:hypothetical protein